VEKQDYHVFRRSWPAPPFRRQLQRQRMSATLEVLLIDNAERDLTEVPGLLVDAGIHFTSHTVDSAAALHTALASQSWDLAFCACGASGFGGPEALVELRLHAPGLPVVAISTVPGEEAAVRAMKAGAADYVMRGRMAHLLPVLQQALGSGDKRNIAGLLSVGGALRESEAGLRRAQMLARLAHIITRPDGSFESFSESLLHLIGRDAEHLPPDTRAWLHILHPEDRDKFRAIAIDAGATGKRVDVEYRLQHGDGTWLHMRQVIEPLHGQADADGRMRWFCTLQDVTDQKRAEEKIRVLNLDLERDMRRRIAAEQEHAALEIGLREAQKMESLGALAGGIAHDFNNLLAAMLGNVSLARMNAGDPHRVRHNLSQVDKAGARARELVKQILSFSRKQPQKFVVQPVRPVVIEALSLLRSTLPAGVELVVVIPDARPTYVNVDGGQISQVLMNLCTNAWHATSGVVPRIEVTLDEVTLEPEQVLRPGGLPANRYVRLRVKDNGHGMDKDLQARIFEPFFTTKPVGQGTGLGLAVVHGIVKAHGGAITVDSVVSSGTTFTVYLPAVSPVEQPLEEPPADAPADGQGKHVMYVDDYDVMCDLVSEVLDAAGYRVTVYHRGEAALADLRATPELFDLIITDQNMPGMAGTELARQARMIRAALPVVISSGYISEELRVKAQEEGVLEVIDKTRSVEQLAAAVASWLNAGVH
jgi:PAS domain S-box-containing protein